MTLQLFKSCSEKSTYSEVKEKELTDKPSQNGNSTNRMFGKTSDVHWDVLGFGLPFRVLRLLLDSGKVVRHWHSKHLLRILKTGIVECNMGFNSYRSNSSFAT
jgi:hypothetical protein